jgi:hypothetical protein
VSGCRRVLIGDLSDPRNEEGIMRRNSVSYGFPLSFMNLVSKFHVISIQNISHDNSFAPLDNS